MDDARSDGKAGLRVVSGTEAASANAEPGLGDRLKAGRLRARLTIKELSEDAEIGVSATFLSRVERNEALPSDELLVKLARRLALDPSELLLHLYRERAVPEVKPYVPRPAVLKVQEALGGRDVASFEGLEAVTGPLSQVLEAFRHSSVESAALRAELQSAQDDLARLGREVTEKNRSFLPEVNKFLVSLFHYESELVRRETVMEEGGDATVHYTLVGIRPRKGMKGIRSLSHTIYIPLPGEGARAFEDAQLSFAVLQKPEGLEVEHRFERESAERAALVVSFPDGFEWRPGSAPLSYHFSYRLKKVFATTLEDAHVRYGKTSLHPDILEWASCFINKPVRTLEVAVTFPPWYAPKYVDKWVWWMEMSFLAADTNLGDKLLLDADEGISIEKGERTTVRLRAKNPLLGFNYGIVWQPLTKMEVLRLRRR